ncbi:MULTISPECIES: response regulator transcription factor [Staphylococcus]|jgi:DNA-binding NarL/FixJ family response regulator|uniref:Response regulator transcription factor n=1 Tax=Staphylococcus hominis TaxID=1290 RepID=A0A3S7GSX0_STAHO|nr:MULTISPECIES: response regulator transcription factor [Staphylococcus]EUZ70274.1 DNA-binding response regulator LuxR [Staphylococcus sp. M0480]OFM63750.1 DNA-binding response regulator [Staphylococcus sp. HMSC062C01]OFM64135.1 DNA-binding response regulator [Staphylococcus sp. HMSC068D07]OFM79693.1 DNA-binding response regulator [Staphylococcus sp. HMSC074B09]OFR36098.1 DNA-binding response regulator [Staphylococcus sp. HMSC063F02]OFS49849.1 DNA-binding response regulator [Staphylococcus s
MISIIIAEDQYMLRKAMVQLIEFNEQMKVVNDCNNGGDAFEFIEKYHPDIAILDIEMPGLTGLEVLSKIREFKIDTKVIIVTTFKRPGYFEKAVANEVDAYVLKERSVEDLIQTIKHVMNGEKEYSTSLMTTLFKESNPLTHKEQVVLREIGDNLSSKEIAEKLYLSDGTVRNYTSNIIDKLNAENRFNAWKKAKEKGWI